MQRVIKGQFDDNDAAALQTKGRQKKNVLSIKERKLDQKKRFEIVKCQQKSCKLKDKADADLNLD